MSIGFQEILVVLVIALLIFGANRLPEVGKALGKGLKEFRKATRDFSKDIIEEDDKEGS